MEETKSLAGSDNILQSLWYKFFPFWPLFCLLAVACLAAAAGVALLLPASYNITATLLINNQENPSRSNSGQPFQAIDAFATRQVVDNEVLVLQSRTLMSNAVKRLRLYAPVYEKAALSTRSAYLSSPVLVEARAPEKLTKGEKVPFAYDPKSKRVTVQNKSYPLDQWVRLPFGTIRFIPNPHQTRQAKNPLFFSVQNPAVVADQLLRNLKVNSVSKLSTTINLTYQADVAEKGEAILNELLRQYLRSSVENENVLATNTLAFVEDRLREVERELDSIERRTQQFRASQNVIDLSEQGRIFLESVAENDRRIVEINAQLAALDQVDRYVRGEGSGISIVPTTLGIEDPVLTQLLQRLNTLELERANLGTTTGENNPIIQSLDSEIQKIRPNIRSIVNNQQARLRASRNNLAGTSGQLGATLRGIPQKERQLLEISRQQVVKRDLYAFLLQRREEAALSSASAIAENRVLDWADASIATPGSKKLLLLAGSLVAAFALGVGYVLVREGVNGKVLFRSEVEELTALPVVGEVAYRNGRRLPFPQSAADAGLAKAFSGMQAALGLYNDQNQNRRFLVTSSLPMEGSSFVANHFAVQLAGTGKKVLLADLNLHSPDTSRLHQLHQQQGFADFVQQGGAPEPFIHASAFPNLDVLPAGSPADNPVRLLLHPQTGSLFAFLAGHYDYVVLDAPPVELATDAFTLAKFCDCSLLVVRHNATPKNLVKKLDGNTRLQTLPRLHLVLNGIKARGFPGRFYGYGYGYGYEAIPKKQLATPG